MSTTFRFGTVAIIGRPNVGKSTLLNTLVGEHVSIVTAKAQTTRNRIAGIRTTPTAQMVFLDTPGLAATDTGLNRRLRRIADAARADADVIVLVVDVRYGPGSIERELLAEAAGDRWVVAVNKIDAVRKSAALPVLAELGALAPDLPSVPVSGRTGTQVAALAGEVERRLPPGPAVFGTDDYTTASTRFLAQELVREQVFLQARAEIPYGAAVVVEDMVPDRTVMRIDAVILVARESHKGILIGAGGSRIKAIGERARPALETLVGQQVHLALQVRVEEDWLARPDRLIALELG